MTRSFSRRARRGPTLVPASLLGSFLLAAVGCSEPIPDPAEPDANAGTRIAVANRGEGTVTLIDVQTLETEEIVLEDGSEPMYAQNPFFSDEIWIGDRGLSRVLVHDARDLGRIAEIPTGVGVFHMWNHGDLRQMWVVCDVDKTMTVISLDSKEVLATVPVPQDLADAGFKPHDMTATASSAIVSLVDEAGGGEVGWLVEFSGETFTELQRREVPGDPHLMYWGFDDSALYVASQAGDVLLRLDPQTLETTGELAIPGAHGMWADEAETHLYVSDIESLTGVDALYTVDIATFTLVPGSPVDAGAPAPHNLMVSLADDRLFATHSADGMTVTSVYAIDQDGLPQNTHVLDTGLTPFGIMLIHAVADEG